MSIRSTFDGEECLLRVVGILGVETRQHLEVPRSPVVGIEFSCSTSLIEDIWIIAGERRGLTCVQESLDTGRESVNTRLDGLEAYFVGDWIGSPSEAKPAG